MSAFSNLASPLHWGGDALVLAIRGSQYGLDVIKRAAVWR